MSAPSVLVIGAAGPMGRPLSYLILTGTINPVITFTPDRFSATIFPTLADALLARSTTPGMPASVVVRFLAP